MPASDYYIAKGEKWTPKYQSFVDRMYGAIGEPLNGSSVTSLTIGTGSKSLTIEVEKSFSPGQPVRVYKDSANYMDGVVTSYDSVTGVMVVNVTSVLGSGTYATWSVGLIGSTVPVDKTINIIGTAVNYPIVAGDLSLSGTIVEGDASLGNITVTLPTIAELNGKIVTVIADVDPAGNALITNKSTGTELHTSYAKGDFLAVTSDGVKYIILDEKVTMYTELSLTANVLIAIGATTKVYTTGYAVDRNIGGGWDSAVNHRFDLPFDAEIDVRDSPITAIDSYFGLAGFVRVNSLAINEKADSDRGGKKLPLRLNKNDYIEILYNLSISAVGAVNLYGNAGKTTSKVYIRLIKRLR